LAVQKTNEDLLIAESTAAEDGMGNAVRITNAVKEYRWMKRIAWLGYEVRAMRLKFRTTELLRLAGDLSLKR
jgi:hypothetical protein